MVAEIMSDFPKCKFRKVIGDCTTIDEYCCNPKKTTIAFSVSREDCSKCDVREE